MIDNAAAQVDVRRILDSLADAVIAADRSGRIAYANAAVERLLGWPPADLAGQPVAVLVPPRLRGAHTAGFRRYVTTGVPRLIGHPTRVSALRRDGGEVDITLTLAALRLSQGEEVIVASLHDVSDSAAIEPPEQREIERQKDYVLSAVAHDLKSPLTS
ncbi:MAG: PAS domain S-box protein, partial [Chloroflexi bacterium]|nr:PAS domain S-box protein [Chloroflexota bacterium]